MLNTTKYCDIFPVKICQFFCHIGFIQFALKRAFHYGVNHFCVLNIGRVMNFVSKHTHYLNFQLPLLMATQTQIEVDCKFQCNERIVTSNQNAWLFNAFENQNLGWSNGLRPPMPVEELPVSDLHFVWCSKTSSQVT